MSPINERDRQVAVQVMSQRCEQTGRPLDVHWSAEHFRELLPRVEAASRAYVETTIAVLDHMTEQSGERAHTVADVNSGAVGDAEHERAPAGPDLATSQTAGGDRRGTT